LNTTQDVIKQLDALLAEYDSQSREIQREDHYDARSVGRILATRMQSAIQRLTLPNSTYAREAASTSKNRMPHRLNLLIGVLIALKADLEAGWLESIVELVHADTHKDYLDMAEELLKKNYKDASAVIAGSSLEVHIRALCTKHGIATNIAGKPKKADTMNADLKKASVYGGLEQKQVTSWLALRNAAAHGQYSDYVESDVRGLIDGIQNFAIKHPA
jgi:hypothetical protein